MSRAFLKESASFTSHAHRLEAYRRGRSDDYAIDVVLEKCVELISGGLCRLDQMQQQMKQIQQQMNQQFRWLVGIQLTTLLALGTFILAKLP